MSLTADLEARFEEADPSGKKWYIDGVFCEKRWLEQKRKVLFLLKEPSLPLKEGLGNLVENPSSGDRWWKPLCLWAYAALKTTPGGTPTFEQALNTEPGDTWHEQGRSVALMNLKKEEGGTTADMRSVRKWAQRERKFLKGQMERIAPNVIVCCGEGVWSIAADVFEQLDILEAHDNKFAIAGDRLWIDLRHPVRSPFALCFYALAGIVHAALGDPRCPVAIR